jgi:hypothetical protein
VCDIEHQTPSNSVLLLLLLVKHYTKFLPTPNAMSSSIAIATQLVRQASNYHNRNRNDTINDTTREVVEVAAGAAVKYGRERGGSDGGEAIRKKSAKVHHNTHNAHTHTQRETEREARRTEEGRGPRSRNGGLTLRPG